MKKKTQKTPQDQTTHTYFIEVLDSDVDPDFPLLQPPTPAQN